MRRFLNIKNMKNLMQNISLWIVLCYIPIIYAQTNVSDCKNNPKLMLDKKYQNAISLITMNRDIEAQRELEKIINGCPTYIDAYLNLADIFSRSGKIEQEQFILKKALGIEPHAVSVLDRLGYVHLNLAKHYFEQKKNGKNNSEIELYIQKLNQLLIQDTYHSTLMKQPVTDDSKPSTVSRTQLPITSTAELLLLPSQKDELAFSKRVVEPPLPDDEQPLPQSDLSVIETPKKEYQLFDFLDQWITAKAKNTVMVLLNCYSDDYKPAQHLPREVWVQRLIQNAIFGTSEQEEIVILDIAIDSDRAKVLLEKRLGNHLPTRKPNVLLNIHLEGDQWKIISEDKI